MKTKGAKIFISIFFPVSDLFVTILTEYVSRLTEEERFGPDDPLFPAPQMGHALITAFAWLACPDVIGKMRRRFAASFETHLKGQASTIQILIAYERYWRGLVSRRYEAQKTRAIADFW